MKFLDLDRNTAEDADWFVHETDRDQPHGPFRTEAVARQFIADLEAWEKAGADPMKRPASNAERYR